MQGIHEFIPTETKIKYINQLLQVGFDTIDFGSFVSPKAIPQMRDTVDVLKGLEVAKTSTKLLAIVANLRGAEEASKWEQIDYLGFPLSLSETFQMRNTNKSIKEALRILGNIQELCVSSNKELVTYLSMGFGNPYHDPYDRGTVIEFVKDLEGMGVRIISLADTIGVSNPEIISYLFNTLLQEFPHIEFGAHLHSNPLHAAEKIAAAYNSGCQRFDGALNGFGGCPMAEDDLVGNMATEGIISYLGMQGLDLGLNQTILDQALSMVGDVFPN